jgi:UrcA family protein
MNEKASSSSGFWLVCSGLGLALGTNTALADKPADVVVRADSSAITVTQVARGSPVHIVSATRRVSYGDLNFNTPTASAVLEKRISDAAADVCRRLDERFPESTPSGRACAEIAIKDALRKVHDSEMAAQRKAQT